MKIALDDIPFLHDLLQAVTEYGQEAYIVGGYVRDRLLRRPNKDIDVVVVGSGIGLAECLHRRIAGSSLAVFKNFGTAMVKWSGGEIEFVGARKESYDRTSRKPIVEDGSLHDDLLRRDFTINSMAISLNQDSFGQLVDPFNGLHDLERKLLKTPLNPNGTFSDDPLRMMRACRFAAQLDFDIDADAFEAINKNKHRIEILSMERIADELNKIISAHTPSYGFKLLYYSGLLEIIFPELVALQGVENLEGKGHKDNFFHTLQVLDNLAALSDNLWLRWAAILHDIAKPLTKKFEKGHGWTFHNHEEKGARMVPQIFKRMKLPQNEKMMYVQKLVRLHLRPISLAKAEVTDSAIRRLLFDAGNEIDDLMLLCRSDITSKNPEKVKKYIQNFDLVEQKLRDVEARDKIRNFQPVLTGDMIMHMFNIPPGPIVGKLKKELREAILEGNIQNEKEASINYVTQLAKQWGLLN